ncbi:MAG: phenylalanine--tRNA ligase subunit beta [Defluviitaleaceae bacterium]|nr:phenylalanine--tRNA ligase subunit beta [Defluviitaleaceae bacterium]
MNIPVSWIKEYFEIEDLKELIEKLTMSGTKVETIHSIGKELDKIVTGRIVNIEKHPNAEKLLVTNVDIGRNKIVNIVTAAKNLKKDDIVPVALPDSTIYGGITINERDFFGIKSYGMLCSITELGYDSTDFPENLEYGIYVFENKNLKLGEDVCDILHLKDDVIELELTTNRPDCYSVHGIFREIKALGYKEKNIKKNKEYSNKSITEHTKDLINIKIENPDECYRYVARVVKNVKIAPSPNWIRRRLILSGIRPKNNIVDITNYVMLEYGQPLHAFDLRKVAENNNKKEIVVRFAKNDENITTLDASKHILQKSNLVIADNEKALAIAGVIGGLDSSITDSTTDVIFESANFLGSSIRKTSKEIGIRTDASTKYEKGIDPNLSLFVINRCMELIEELCIGEVVEGWVDNYPTKIESHTFKCSFENVNKILGTNIPKKEMINILQKLEIQAKDDILYIPTFRKDITNDADIAEEIVRIYGFENIEPTLDNVVAIGRKTKKQIVEENIIDILKSLGLNQIMTYSFENPKVFEKLNIELNNLLRDTVNISNPLGESSIMRSTTISSMLNTISLNYNRRNNDIYLFEIGKIYKNSKFSENKDNKPIEKLMLTIGIMPNKNFDFYELKSITDELFRNLSLNVDYRPYKECSYTHPGRTANILIDKKEIGIIGQVNPLVLENFEIKENVYICIVDMDEIISFIDLDKTYIPIIKYPKVTRDISIKVKSDIWAYQIEEIIKNCSGKLIENLNLFDIYQGNQIEDGYKSMAYSLTFRDKEKTLSDKEINIIMEKIINTLKENLGVMLRV